MTPRDSVSAEEVRALASDLRKFGLGPDIAADTARAREAADALEALAAENAKKEEEFQVLGIQMAEIAAENERLRKRVVESFARLAPSAPPRERTDD